MLYADKSDLDRKVDLIWMKPGDVLLMHVKEIGIEILVGFSFNEKSSRLGQGSLLTIF